MRLHKYTVECELRLGSNVGVDPGLNTISEKYVVDHRSIGKVFSVI
jgi:hypothetical protein